MASSFSPAQQVVREFKEDFTLPSRLKSEPDPITVILEIAAID